MPMKKMPSPIDQGAFQRQTAADEDVGWSEKKIISSNGVKNITTKVTKDEHDTLRAR
jgi:hypothetical protein